MTAAAAGLFLAVYTSSPVIRILFIPLCYAVLGSPFALVLLIYGPLNIDTRPYVPFLEYALPRLLGLAILLSAATRLLSRLAISVAATEENPKSVPPRPYWVHGLEHLLDVVWGGERFWTGARDSSTHSIFGLVLSGAKHNVLISPQMAKKIEASESAATPFGQRVFLQNVFGLKADSTTIDDLLIQFTKKLQTNDFNKHVARRLEQELPNLTSFMPTLIDQMPWERMADVDMEESPNGMVESARASLKSLVSEFLSFVTTTTLLGSAFTTNYPQFATDLASLSASFHILAVGLPRWFPVRGIVPAHSARRNLMNQLNFYHNTLDLSSSGEQATTTYGDLSDISPLFLELIQEAKKHGLGPEERAKLTLALLWHIMHSTVPLASWLLLHLLNDAKRSADPSSSVLQALRTEVAPHARASQTRPILGISEPPTLKFNSLSSLSTSPTLQATLLETIRLDYGAWRLLSLKNDIEVPEEDLDQVAKASEKTVWRLRKDEWVHLAGALYNSSPKAFQNPNAWEPARYGALSSAEIVRSQDPDAQIIQGDQVKRASVAGSKQVLAEEGIKPLTELAVAFVVGTFLLWDMEIPGVDDVDGKGSVQPGGWRQVNKNVELKLRRRKLRD